MKSQLPGRERVVRLGGEGTPLVAEFAPAVLAARVQLSAHAGRRLVAEVLDLEHRLPQLWAGLNAMEVRPGHARFVARQTRDLSVAEAVCVDAQVAPYADGRLSWARFETLVEAAIVAADPVAAAAREHAAARESFAKTTRSSKHGMRGFYVRADFATVTRIDATVAFLAQALLALGDTSPLDARRVKAVLIMANPTQALRILQAFGALRDRLLPDDTAPAEMEPEVFDPASATAPPPEGAVLEDLEAALLPVVQLFVHLGGGPVGRVEGTGPVTATWVREHLGERCRFKITPVLDPLAQRPVDAWEIPTRHRQAVHLLTPADTFPYASNTTRAVQIDHTQPFRHGGPPGQPRGQSRVGNYGPMTRFHHRIKTHGAWGVRQPFPGLYVWRDPYGATYLVDHTGTRRLPAPTANGSPLEARVLDLVLAG